MFVYIKENEMKKVALSLLAFALVGSMAFGQDAPAPVVKLSGYVNTGIKWDKADGKDATVSSYADDYGAAGTWGKVTASVSEANYGATVTLKASDALITHDFDYAAYSAAATAYAADPTVANKAALDAVTAKTYGGLAILDTAKAWFSPVTGLTGYVGTGYNDGFDGIDDQSNDNFFGTAGYGVTLASSGFTLGAQAGPASYNFNYSVGAAYALENVAAVRFSAKTAGNAFSDYAISGSVSAVTGLTLNGGFFASAVNTTAVNALDLTVAYAITEAFTAGVTSYDFITAEYFKIGPYVTYVVVPGVTVGGYFNYYTEGKDKVTNIQENEIKGKVTWAVGGGSLISWVDYKTQAKLTSLYTEYVISF
jgi:hypothetical protein